MTRDCGSMDRSAPLERLPPSATTALRLGLSLGCLFVLNTSCSQPNRPASPKPSPAAASPTSRCATASLVVVSNGEPVVGADSVETQLAILRSRSFNERLERRSSDTSFHLARVSQSAVINIAAQSTGTTDVLAECETFMNVATSYSMDQPAKQAASAFLQGEAQRLEDDLQKKTQALRDFQERNDLQLLSVEDRQEMVREQMVALKKARRRAGRGKRAEIDEALEQVKEEAFRLGPLAVEEKRLLRDIHTAEAMLNTVRERLAARQVDLADSTPLRALDACQVGPCPQTVQADNHEPPRSRQ